VESFVLMFIAAFALLAAEMLTGTFYLLVLAIGVACGGAAGWLGAGFTMQLLAAVVLGGIGIALVHWWRVSGAAGRKPEQPLDIGETVQVESWNADGTARVRHRGTQWDAALDDPVTSREGTLYIKAMRGSTLILSNHKP
jgi:membrane protein implicated in regulation of membrane protease activity